MADDKDNIREDIAAGDKTPEQEEARFWEAELKWAHTAGGGGASSQKDWEERVKKITERYMDERGEYTERDIAKPQRRLNMLWANVETIGPAMFNRPPVPNVTLANKDKDPIGRWAAICLERCIEAEIRDDEFMSSMQQSVLDLLLGGRGVVWLEYDADVDGDDDDATVSNQRIIVRYVHWKDFRTNRARNWPEVTWIARRAFLTRKELVKKYGDKIGNAVTLDHRPEEYRQDPITQQQFSKATVWQIMDATTGKIIEIAPGYKTGVLAKRDPAVKFPKFFAAPRPIFATLCGESLIPTPDYVQYQDQAEEIDQLTNRIYNLSKALRLRGLYDQSFGALSQIFNDANDNELIPVENYQVFREKGGVEGVMAWLPLKDVIAALIGAYDAREKAIESMYQVTGVADIMRGATEPTETASAQQLKSQYGGLRLRDRQQEIQRFARDIIRMMAEVISQCYTMETIQEMSGVKLLTREQQHQVQQWQLLNQQRAQQSQLMAQQAQQMGAQPPQPMQPLPPPLPPDLMEVVDEPVWEDVFGLLRNGKLRRCVIDVEADSTIEPDQNAEREAATQFLSGMTQYITAWAEILPGAPQLAPLCAEGLSFAARKWKISDTFQTKIDEAAKAIEDAAGQPKAPDPKVQAEQMRAQGEAAKTKGTIQVAGVKANAEQTKAKLEVVQTALEHQAAVHEIQQQSAQSAQEHQQKMEQGQMEMAQQQAATNAPKAAE